MLRYYERVGLIPLSIEMKAAFRITVAMTILYTWMYNNTRGSVLLAYLFHAAANTWSQVFSIDHANQSLNWIITGLLILAAVIVVVAMGTEHLSSTTDRIQE